jgi:hypothetical protein
MIGAREVTMSNSRLALAIACCVLAAGCGGDKDPSSGTGGGSATPYAPSGPEAGGRPVGAGQRGHEGKGARGGPIEVPPLNEGSAYSVEQAKAKLTGMIAPHCPGGALCVRYEVVGGGKCYNGHAPQRFYPHATITIRTGPGLCDIDGETPDVTEEPQPSETPTPPENPAPSSTP